MAKVIMVQGTMSNVGKSLLVAGLCRVFRQDGYKVAPFKSQNMALNSYITKDGKEIGRAQAMQAEACGIEPTVEMNPILLKPTSDMGSQVIINGEVYKNQKAMEYFKDKKRWIPEIMNAYEKLSKEYDIIVIEGAGSPAEINLKQDDIVNMGLAKLVNAPVLLIGDIDRGGVFAQLVGTLLLLEEEEVQRVKGLIINKFRGDVKILEPGLDMLEEKCKKKVLGVVPYVSVDIEEEDSLSGQLEKKAITAPIDIVVIHLPHISNFTDVDALSNQDEVSVRFVRKVEEIKNPDMIVLPGSKNTMDDLIWLRESGLEAMIQKKVEKGVLLFGICGGYQMLGRTIEDPFLVEAGGFMRGMNLLPTKTVFGKEKVRRQIKGIVSNIEGPFARLSLLPVSGYEIHMGETTILPDEDGFEVFEPFLRLNNDKIDGVIKDNIAGTYLHGIFDSDEMTDAMIELLYKRKGLKREKKNSISYQEYKEKQYNSLAHTIRASINMEKVYQILEEDLKGIKIDESM